MIVEYIQFVLFTKQASVYGPSSVTFSFVIVTLAFIMLLTPVEFVFTELPLPFKVHSMPTLVLQLCWTLNSIGWFTVYSLRFVPLMKHPAVAVLVLSLLHLSTMIVYLYILSGWPTVVKLLAPFLSQGRLYSCLQFATFHSMGVAA